SVNNIGFEAAGGTFTGRPGVHCEATPSHTQVSLNRVNPLLPPNSTSLWMVRSYAIEVAKRPDGARKVCTFFQFAPSNVHVSLDNVPFASKPPKTTTFLLMGS